METAIFKLQDFDEESHLRTLKLSSTGTERTGTPSSIAVPKPIGDFVRDSGRLIRRKTVSILIQMNSFLSILITRLYRSSDQSSADSH